MGLDLLDLIPTPSLDANKQQLEFENWKDSLNTNLSSTTELFNEVRKSSAKEEMLKYVMTLVNKEFDGSTEKDALDKWEEYKSLYNLDEVVK